MTTGRELSSAGRLFVQHRQSTVSGDSSDCPNAERRVQLRRVDRDVSSLVAELSRMRYELESELVDALQPIVDDGASEEEIEANIDAALT